MTSWRRQVQGPVIIQGAGFPEDNGEGLRHGMEAPRNVFPFGVVWIIQHGG